jgi:two-component system, chemotaxis family, sensor kinase CheA
MEKKYQEIFFQEADQKIADLNAALLLFEKNQIDEKAINDAMRAAHTLKSSAAAMEYEAISQTAHEMEDLFEIVRTKKKRLSQDAVEVLFAATDALQFALSSLKSGEDARSSSGLLERVHVRIKKIKDEDDSSRKPEFKHQDQTLVNKDTQATASVQQTDVPESGDAENGEVDTQTSITQEDKKNLQSELEHLKPIEAIKVNIKTLDMLMNLTEELLVENMRLAEIVRIKKENPDTPLPLDILENTKDSFNRLVTELQYHVTQARMLPLGQVLERFPRLIRDLSKKMNKTVDFRVVGQDIELDRTVIDRLGEPLIHLIRNAVDHGISDTGTVSLHASRMKDTVVIDIENTGKAIDWHSVVRAGIERGIVPPEKGQEYLRMLDAKANELAGELKFRMLRQLKHLLFHSQLSTKQEVTETSGRGVGLHIVKSVIESFGGTVSVESPIEGTAEGTRFTLRLPLTLAIIQAMLVKVGSQTFAVPFTQIDRTVRILPEQIMSALDQEVAVVDEEDVPIIRLRERFKISDLRFTIEEEKDTELPIIASKTEDLPTQSNQKSKIKNLKSEIIKSELMLITKPGTLPIAGLIVDELVAEQDIVVKPLKGVLQKTKGFAGITLLGDGKPALILDVATLI